MAGADFPEPRLFSLDEAQTLLPRLREIVADLRNAREKLAIAQSSIEQRYPGAGGNGHVAPGGETARLNLQVEEAQREIMGCVRAIAALGCELKDPDRGMVDFRTTRDGRVVYLCWLVEEPRIIFWHEMDGGFRGRQPL
ncbi:MAG: hypothetical protein HW416_768 [Chloroflexi bacterium]|nr:hypothetical protein [Chloroflexota bacterium]